MNTTVSNLQSMSLADLQNYVNSIPQLSIDQKRRAWNRMDTGICDSEGNLIGDTSTHPNH